MNAIILHESRGRIRLRLKQNLLTLEQADYLEAFFQKEPWVIQAKVHERTRCLILYYHCERAKMLKAIQNFSFEQAKNTITLPSQSSRSLNREFQEKLVGSVLWKGFSTVFLPKPLQIAQTIWKMLPILWKGLCCLWKRRITVDLLDALSISLSAARKDFKTAGSVIFLLHLSEMLEEWTRKKSIDDLAQCMSLNIDRVWLQTPQGEVLTPIADIQPGDKIIVRTGSIIPVDGVMVEGEMTVNESSLTGESTVIAKQAGSMLYAGTVIEEGSCVLRVLHASGKSRYDQIVAMIEQSEQLKSSAENHSSNLADRLVPYTFAGSLLCWAFTRNAAKALSVLMVDFSCALKLSMPLAVLSAMRQASTKHITVKGGKFLEAVAQVDTIVFDKTGTLTHACPQVAQVIPFGGHDENEMLRLAACLEEHFPHSMANAVVEEANRRGLTHEEMHSKVEYLVAHGIVSTVNEHRVLIGSVHFVFEDENCQVRAEDMVQFEHLPTAYSHLYLAINNELAAVICIFDPLREEAKAVLHTLKQIGIKKTVMLTGDSKRTAQTIAAQVCVDDFQAEVLPDDKASYIAQLQQQGHLVMMIGDGINDSPALSQADVGVAISDGAALAREIADITIAAESLWEIVTLRQLSTALMKRIRFNYRFVLSFNGMLIALGTGGILSPAACATLHNVSTLGISLQSMTPLAKKSLQDEKKHPHQ